MTFTLEALQELFKTLASDCRNHDCSKCLHWREDNGCSLARALGTIEAPVNWA